MRYYPNADPFFYCDEPEAYERHCRYLPTHRWCLPHWKSVTAQTKYMRYYRDFESAKKPQITLKDLYFPKWNASRIRPGACLPLLYAMGSRFIKLEKAPPADFRCSPLPMSLAEVRDTKKKLRAQAKALKKWKKYLKAKAKECKGKKNKVKPYCKRLARQEARKNNPALQNVKKKTQFSLPPNNSARV